LCAFLAPEPVPAGLLTDAAGELPGELAARAADPLAWQETLDRLDRSSLARVDHRGLQMHRLTQAIVRDWLSPRERWAGGAVELVASAFPSSIEGVADPGQWPRCAQLLPHARVAAEHGPAPSQGTGQAGPSGEADKLGLARLLLGVTDLMVSGEGVRPWLRS
jgi:hypothetical protein